MAKKIQNKRIQNKKINNGNEMVNFIKIIVFVTLIFLLFYLLTVFINKGKEKDESTETPKTTTPATIQFDEILIGDIFKQPNKKYYVLVEDIDDAYVKVYTAYLSNYKEKTDAKRVYTSVINNIFNSSYLSSESNLSNNIKKLKFKGTTLLEISNGKIVKSYQTYETITEHLKEISKSEE